MFDGELGSVIALFAAIAALIAYINQRSKSRIKANASPFQLKRMPGKGESQPEGSDLEEWNFPQSTYESAPPSSSPVSLPYLETMPIQTYASAVSAGPSYQEIAAPAEHVEWRTARPSRRPHPRLGTQERLRESIITMTILGPCRALAPFQERE